MGTVDVVGVTRVPVQFGRAAAYRRLHFTTGIWNRYSASRFTRKTRFGIRRSRVLAATAIADMVPCESGVLATCFTLVPNDRISFNSYFATAFFLSK